MKLPSGALAPMFRAFMDRRKFVFLGCFSFERRCRAVVEVLGKKTSGCERAVMIEIASPKDAFPDYSATIKEKVERNVRELRRRKYVFAHHPVDLLCGEDVMLDLVDSISGPRVSSVVLDITCFPKRFFCFILKRLLISSRIENVLVTYSEVGSRGYALGHLAEDAMTCDYLPGFSGSFPPRGSTVAICAGFEALGMASLLEIFPEETRNMKLILAFPPNGPGTRRQWTTVRQLTYGRAREIRREDVEVIAAWDAEQVYETLHLWDEEQGGLTLAPFGPKPHTLGMALFAIEHEAALYYSQPKAYNPEYSKGYGTAWCYVAKWDGRAAYEVV